MHMHMYVYAHYARLHALVCTLQHWLDQRLGHAASCSTAVTAPVTPGSRHSSVFRATAPWLQELARRLVEEQDAEYEASLAADRQREAEREVERRRQARAEGGRVGWGGMEVGPRGQGSRDWRCGGCGRRELGKCEVVALDE